MEEPKGAAAPRPALTERERSLVRAAYHVAARKGTHRVTLQDIADHAGVSKGLLLYHFKTRENLLLATMRWALLRTADRIRVAVAEAEGPRARISALVGAIWSDPQANRDFGLLSLDLVEHAARVPSFSGLPTMTREIILGLYAEMLGDGLGMGRRSHDPEATALVMRALIDGLLLLWLQEQDWRATHARYREACEAALVDLLDAASVPDDDAPRRSEAARR